MAGHTSARSHARLAALGMALAAVVLVAGCGDSEEPDGAATPTATTSVTETATGSPTTETPEPTETALPPLPEAATENTPEGAEAFIRYWFDVVNTGYKTGQTGLVPVISDPQCVACKGIEEQIAALADADQRVKLAPFEIVSMSTVGGGAPDVTTFNVEVLQPENEFLSETGDVVRESAALEKSGEVGVIWEGSKWLLYDSAVN